MDHNLSSLIQTPTCFKSKDGRCFDLILTNRRTGCFNTRTFETGFSDFHHMVYTNLKTAYTRLLPRITMFRSYRTFSNKIFRAELAQKLSDCQTSTFEGIQQIYLDTFSKLALFKTISIRGDIKPRMSKELRKAIMKRTMLKRIANTTQSDENVRKYKKQKHLVVKSNKQAKTGFYKKLDPKKMNSEQVFW